MSIPLPELRKSLGFTLMRLHGLLPPVDTGGVHRMCPPSPIPCRRVRLHGNLTLLRNTQRMLRKSEVPKSVVM